MSAHYAGSPGVELHKVTPEAPAGARAKMTATERGRIAPTVSPFDIMERHCNATHRAFERACRAYDETLPTVGMVHQTANALRDRWHADASAHSVALHYLLEHCEGGE